MAVIGVLRIPPVMIRKPIFWIFSRRCVFVLATVAKVGDPYSITGRTLPLCTCLTVLMSAPQVVPASFFMILNLRSVFFCVFSMWGTHVRRLSNVIPRYVGVSFCGRQVSSKRILYFLSLVESEKRVVAVFVLVDLNSPGFRPVTYYVGCFLYTNGCSCSVFCSGPDH